MQIGLTDYLGNLSSVSKTILSDILIERGDGYNQIKIDSIIFPTNSNNLFLLSDEQVDKNFLIFQKISDELEKFPSYDIRIEGHGNIIHDDIECIVKKIKNLILLV